MALMTHTLVTGQVIDVPASSAAYWATRGWVVAAAGSVVTPLTTVAPTLVYREMSHPNIPGRTSRIPFNLVPSFWALLGWT